MRVIEPSKEPKPVPPKRRGVGGMVFSLVVVVGIGYLGYTLFIDDNVQQVATNVIEEPVAEESEPTLESQTTAGSNEKTLPQDFNGNEFRIFYDNLVQANVTKPDVPPTITGDDIADARIRDVAEKRGYLQRGTAATTLPFVDGYALQEVVHKSWLDLKSALSENGSPVEMVSGFRSVNGQRELFLERLNLEGVSVFDIAAGTADEAVDAVLKNAAPPGYSKHHTGYTIDMLCLGYAFDNFKDSTCNDILTADNYALAREFGFIPSYPADADLQGPEPEAWEYVWVGSDVIM